MWFSKIYSPLFLHDILWNGTSIYDLKQMNNGSHLIKQISIVVYYILQLLPSYNTLNKSKLNGKQTGETYMILIDIVTLKLYFISPQEIWGWFLKYLITDGQMYQCMKIVWYLLAPIISSHNFQKHVGKTYFCNNQLFHCTKSAQNSGMKYHMYQG